MALRNSFIAISEGLGTTEANPSKPFRFVGHYLVHIVIGDIRRNRKNNRNIYARFVHEHKKFLSNVVRGIPALIHFSGMWRWKSIIAIITLTNNLR